MTTLLAENTGQLTIAMSDHRFDEVAFQSAAEVVTNGETLIVIDAAGCFDPARMTHSARIGTIDPSGLISHLHVLRARSAEDLANLILHRLEDAFERLGTRHVLIPDLLATLYDPRISTRDAARILGQVKLKLEELAAAGAQIVVLCRRDNSDLGTRSHFLPSLCAAADHVYSRSNT
jgi:hypothetical protein